MALSASTAHGTAVAPEAHPYYHLRSPALAVRLICCRFRRVGACISARGHRTINNKKPASPLGLGNLVACGGFRLCHLLGYEGVVKGACLAHSGRACAMRSLSRR